MPYEVFFSYTREKEPDAGMLYKDLQRQLHIRVGSTADIFKDTERLKTGDDWQDVLNDEIKSATIFLLLLSAQWLKSRWCTAEYDAFRESMATNRRKKIFPVQWVPVPEGVLDNEDQKKRNIEITRGELFDFTNLQGHNFDSQEVKIAINNLADEITKYLASVRGQ